MYPQILKYGLVAGVVVGGIMFGVTVASGGEFPVEYGMLIGYGSMLLALSAIFVGIKRHRDDTLGGVIRFWPAFGMGLAISFIAGVFYVLAWEASQAITHADFATVYSNSVLEQARAAGKSAAELAKLSAEMAQFKLQYANPAWRMGMTFTEIFPVGVLVSLVSAALLRNSRFLAAKRA